MQTDKYWSDFQNTLAAINTMQASGVTLWLVQLFGKSQRVITKPNGDAHLVKKFRGKEYML